MILTEERVIPKLMNPRSGLLREHIARYEFAAEHASGRVLDIACGVGYGTSILLNNNGRISSFLGVDIDLKSVDYAKEHYPHQKAEYIIKDAMDKSLFADIGSFDTVISFETIEHLNDDHAFMQNIKELVKPNGKLIISTPFGRGRNKPCSDPFHVHQYKEEEFVEVLGCFNSIKMHYQVDEIIEEKIHGKKYYLMVAICKTPKAEKG